MRRCSLDGESQIIYTRGWIDKMNDQRESALWIMNADGSKNRFLVRGSNARWSPTGDRIVYTAQGEPQGSQIFVRCMDAEGATSQITRVEQAPANDLVARRHALAFTMNVEKNTWPIKMPKPPEGAKWTETPRIVERLDYRQRRQGFNDDGYRHMFVVPATGGTPRQLTDGNWDHNGIEWTPDGKQILFTALRVPDAEYQWRESEIYAVERRHGAITQLTQRKGPTATRRSRPTASASPTPATTGRSDTWIDSKLYVMNIDGSEPAPGLGRLGSLAAELQWKAGRHRPLLHRADRGLAEPLLPADGRRAPARCSRSPRARTCSRRRHLGEEGQGRRRAHARQKPGDIVTFDLKKPAQSSS